MRKILKLDFVNTSEKTPFFLNKVTKKVIFANKLSQVKMFTKIKILQPVQAVVVTNELANKNEFYVHSGELHQNKSTKGRRNKVIAAQDVLELPKIPIYLAKQAIEKRDRNVSVGYYNDIPIVEHEELDATQANFSYDDVTTLITVFANQYNVSYQDTSEYLKYCL
jgi:hypothetical protein